MFVLFSIRKLVATLKKASVLLYRIFVFLIAAVHVSELSFLQRHNRSKIDHVIGRETIHWKNVDRAPFVFLSINSETIQNFHFKPKSGSDARRMLSLPPLLGGPLKHNLSHIYACVAFYWSFCMYRECVNTTAQNQIRLKYHQYFLRHTENPHVNTHRVFFCSGHTKTLESASAHLPMPFILFLHIFQSINRLCRKSKFFSWYQFA